MPHALARRRRIRREPLVSIAPESGRAFTARTGRPELSSHERPSPAVVLENGRPLGGPANALHEDIRRAGAGRYSFWHDHVYFAASDGSDPRTNGRRYEIAFGVGAVRGAALRVRDVVRPAPRATLPAVMSGGYDADLLLRTWRRLGFELGRQATVLDFGCGGGERVTQLRRKGIDAFGADTVVPFHAEGDLGAAIDAGVVRPIALAPYRLPFGDASCDVVFSVTVLEHVMDYDTALAEIARVLKPGGLSVHIFPSRWKPLETHAFVPFASVCQSHWWLQLWALAGIRNQFQAGCSARETAAANVRFLREETNYLTRQQIQAAASRHFGACEFREETLFKPARYARFQHLGLFRLLWRRWTSATSVRVLVLRQPRPR